MGNTPITLNTKTALQGRFLLFYIIHHLSLIVHTYPHPFGIPSVKVRSDNEVVTGKSSGPTDQQTV